MTPDCVMVPAVSRVKTPVAKSASGVKEPILMLPVLVSLPIRTLVLRMVLSSAAVSCMVPVPPPMPMVVELVVCSKRTVAALPVSVAEPPI